MNQEEWQRAIARVCNQGPYTIDLSQSNRHVQVWHCGTCGATLRFGTTVSIPASWSHYKPGHEPTQIPRAFYKAFEKEETA